MKRVSVAIALAVLFASATTACTTQLDSPAPAASSVRTADGESTPDPDSTASVPNGLAAAQNAAGGSVADTAGSGSEDGTGATAGVPDRYNDSGTGIAYEFGDHSGTACGYHDRCSVLNVYATSDCPSMVYVEANELDADKVVIGYTNGTLSAFATGQQGRIILPILETDTASIQLTKVNCYYAASRREDNQRSVLSLSTSTLSVLILAGLQ